MQHRTGEAGKPVMDLEGRRREGAVTVHGEPVELTKATCICCLGAFCILRIDSCTFVQLCTFRIFTSKC